MNAKHFIIRGNPHPSAQVPIRKKMDRPPKEQKKIDWRKYEQIRWSHTMSVAKLVEEAFGTALSLLGKLAPGQEIAIRVSMEREMEDLRFLQEDLLQKLWRTSIWVRGGATPGSFSCPYSHGCEKLATAIMPLGEPKGSVKEVAQAL